MPNQQVYPSELRDHGMETLAFDLMGAFLVATLAGLSAIIIGLRFLPVALAVFLLCTGVVAVGHIKRIVRIIRNGESCLTICWSAH